MAEVNTQNTHVTATRLINAATAVAAYLGFRHMTKNTIKQIPLNSILSGETCYNASAFVK
jgi:hypothetical protein